MIPSSSTLDTDEEQQQKNEGVAQRRTAIHINGFSGTEANLEVTGATGCERRRP